MLHSLAALAQNPVSPEQPSSVFTSRTSVVLIPALVRTKSGAIVYTLQTSDFLVTDDGVAQEVTLAQDTGHEPLALVVVVEVGGAGTRQFQKYSSIAPPLAPMLASIVGNVPRHLAVVTFDSRPTLLQGFTADAEKAADALRTLRPDRSVSTIWKTASTRTLSTTFPWVTMALPFSTAWSML